MFDTLKNLPSWFFVRPNYDFFGPEASSENLECGITMEPAFDHLVQDCNEGVGRVQVIDAMAKQIVESKVRPVWLRHNASVDLEELKKTIDITEKVAEKLLTEEGFVKLSDLHFFDRENTNLTYQSQFEANQFAHCPSCRHKGKQVTFSPAIALRIFMGKSFNPKACPKAFEENHAPEEVDLVYGAKPVTEPTKTLEAIKSTMLDGFDMWFWSRAVAVAAITAVFIGALYYAGYVPSFNTLANKGF